LTVTIRRYRDSDRAAVYGICVETANAGQGARGRYSTVSYVIGTANTPDFVAAYIERWLPRLRDRYGPQSGPPRNEEEYRLVHPTG
jgi:hypothetical protein